MESLLGWKNVKTKTFRQTCGATKHRLKVNQNSWTLLAVVARLCTDYATEFHGFVRVWVPCFIPRTRLTGIGRSSQRRANIQRLATPLTH